MKKTSNKTGSRAKAATPMTTAETTTSTTAADSSAATMPDEVMGSMDIVVDDHVPAGQENMAAGNNAVQVAVSTTTATMPITTTATTAPASGGTGANTSTGATPVITRAVADLDPADPAADRANVCFCAVIRLIKAMLAALLGAGMELAKVQQELGTGFNEFITTQTAWNTAEAKTLIQFAAQAGLSPEGLKAAVDVPLGTVMTAMAFLGELYTAEVEHNNDVAH